MNPGWPWSWRYALGAVGRWALFLAAVWTIAYAAKTKILYPWELYGLALIPAACVATQFQEAYRVVVGQDEFVRQIIVKRMLVAAGMAMTLATAWSAAEPAGLPHLHAWLIYPLTWGLYGVMTPLIRDSRV